MFVPAIANPLPALLATAQALGRDQQFAEYTQQAPMRKLAADRLTGNAAS
jgi:hypothetical protein